MILLALVGTTVITDKTTWLSFPSLSPCAVKAEPAPDPVP